MIQAGLGYRDLQATFLYQRLNTNSIAPLGFVLPAAQPTTFDSYYGELIGTFRPSSRFEIVPRFNVTYQRPWQAPDMTRVVLLPDVGAPPARPPARPLGADRRAADHRRRRRDVRQRQAAGPRRCRPAGAVQRQPGQHRLPDLRDVSRALLRESDRQRGGRRSLRSPEHDRRRPGAAPGVAASRSDR